MADYTTYMYILYIYMVYTLLEYTTGLDITVCRNGGNFPSVNLNCSTNDIIHVESIVYFYNESSDCSGSSKCGTPLTNTDTGLISSCTGEPSPCSQFIPNTGNCTGSTVNYRCIPKENGQDMCQSPFNLTDDPTQIFLISPNYPTSLSGFERNETGCQCSIRGASITSITILDLRLQTGSDGTRSNLFIQYGDITYNKTSRENPQSNLQLYNHRLQSTSPSTTADIIFTHQQIHGQKLWIEIQGISFGGSCNKAATYVSPKPRSTTPVTSPSQPDSTTTSGTSPSSTGTTIHTSTDSSTSSEPSSVHSTAATNTDSSTTTDPSSSSDRSTDTSERSQPALHPSDNEAPQTDNDKDIIIIALATILSLSMIVAIVLFLVYRKGKLKCQNRPSNPGTGNSRTITPSEPRTTYSTLSDTDRNNTDSSYQELQTRNSNSPYNNLPYSGTDIEPGTNYSNLPYSGTDIEPGMNYSSLSDGNRLATDNNNYLQLETRTTTSPYNNLPYTSEHHTYSNQ